jgi:hypothetical protein
MTVATSRESEMKSGEEGQAAELRDPSGATVAAA